MRAHASGVVTVPFVVIANVTLFPCARERASAYSMKPETRDASSSGSPPKKPSSSVPPGESDASARSMAPRPASSGMARGRFLPT